MNENGRVRTLVKYTAVLQALGRLCQATETTKPPEIDIAMNLNQCH